MIQLSYSTFGLTNLDFLDAIEATARAGYPGVELSFHRDQFNPFNITAAFRPPRIFSRPSARTNRR